MKWIMSGGGPLICLEQQLGQSWGGIDRLSVSSADATTDYDRACRPGGYLSVIPLRSGDGVIIVMPFDTSVCRAPSGSLIIVQVEYAPLDFDDGFDQLLANLDESIFDDPYSSIRASFKNAALTMFDSAEPGNDIIDGSLHFDVTPGSYRILTREYEPDREVSLVLHKFELTL